MDALTFLRERKRMCESFGECKIACPLYNYTGINEKCMHRLGNAFETEVECVEKWSAEHPKKTLLMDFLEKYPNAQLYKDGTPRVCIRMIGYKMTDYYSKCRVGITEESVCCAECWNRPLPEE